MAMDTIITAAPKSVQLADLIRREIESGKFRKGERLCPTRTIAQKYAVTKQIAQSAFDILRKEGLIVGHVGRGTFVASNATSIAAKTVALILDGLADEHERLHSLLPAHLLDKGFFSYLFDVGGTKKKTNREKIRAILKEKPLALVVDAYSLFDFTLLDEAPPETRLIFVKRFEGARRHDASYVLADYEAGARLACEWLLGRGRKRIALLSFPKKTGLMSDLLARGCEQTLAGGAVESFKELAASVMDDETLERQLDAGGFPDGIFCHADYVYGRVSEILTQRGMLLGRDVDVVGCGNTPWAKAYKIPSVDYQYEEMARTVVELVACGETADVKIKPELRFNW